jgi:hypothetical protein
LTFFQFKSVKKISIFFFKFLILSSKEGGSSNLCRCDESCYAFGDCCFDAARTFGQTKLSAKPNAPLPQCVKYHDGKVEKKLSRFMFFFKLFFPRKSEILLFWQKNWHLERKKARLLNLFRQSEPAYYRIILRDLRVRAEM